MDHLVKLQLLNLLKKYEYLCAELEVKSEISAISQGVFWENIERVVGKDDRLGDLAGSLRPDPVPPTPSVPMSEFPEDDNSVRRDDALRSIYRSVAKLTHPDRVKNGYLNAMYVESTRCMREGDDVGMYSIAVRLGIDVDLPEALHESLVKRISETESKIRFLESSYHMRWHYSDKSRKIDLVCEYIERNLLRLYVA
jgi:hypothetical protein